MVHIQPASESFNVAAQIVNVSNPIPVNTPGEDIAAYYAEVAQHYAEETAGLLDTKVSKTGDTMTGDITIEKNLPHFIGKSTVLDKTSTTVPEGDGIFGAILQTKDCNGEYVSNIATIHNTNNDFVLYGHIERNIGGVNKSGSFGFFVNTEGKDLAYASDGVRQSITGWSFPSSTREQVPLGANEAIYTAPADGWVRFESSNTAGANSYYYLRNLTAVFSDFVEATSASVIAVLNIPVAKGQQYQMCWYGGGVPASLYFVHAIGG